MANKCKSYTGKEASWAHLYKLVMEAPVFTYEVKSLMLDLLERALAGTEKFPWRFIPMDEIQVTLNEEDQVLALCAFWTSQTECFCITFKAFEVTVIRTFKIYRSDEDIVTDVRKLEILDARDILDYLIVHQGAPDLCRQP